MMENETLRVLQKLDDLNEKVTAMDKKLDVTFAELPVHFVTRAEYDTAKKELIVTRRWTMGTVVAVLLGVWSNWPPFA
jgi:hypothetical protein